MFNKLWKFFKKKENDSSKIRSEDKISKLAVLSPNTKLTGSHYELYKTYLHEAIDNENSVVSNIAITGKYGSGKSSIIDTYFWDRNDYLRVSFATFENTHLEAKKRSDSDPERKDNNNQAANFKLSDGYIFSNIINQIIYQLDPKDIPLTKFKIKRQMTSFNKFLFIFLLVLVFTLFMHLGFWISIFRDVVLVVSGVIFFWILLSNFEFSGFKLNFKNIETEIDMSRDDLFEKYTDEIIYLFKQSGKRILIIEDLDRFNNLDIFEKLRELNIKLNYSDDKHWKFVYLLKDSLFKNPNDRVKFFDQIIPVIPFITSSNSIDKLRKLFPNNSDRLLQILGAYIDDYRLLLNIQSEYSVYEFVSDQKIEDESVQQRLKDQNELLALIAYKNLHPSDFDDLQNGKGVLANLIAKYKQNITEQIFTLDEKIKSIKLNRATSAARNEVEYLFLYANRHNLQYYKSYRLEPINSLQTASKIINDDMSVGPGNTGNGWSKYSIFKKNTLEYANGVLAATVYNEEILKLQQKKETLKHYKLKSITRDFASDADELLFALLKNGYISENYLNTINHYYGDPSNLTFMKNIYAEGEDVDEELPLKDFKGLLSQLQDDDFDKPQILNVNLVQYLGEHNDRHFEKVINTADKLNSDVIEKAINQNTMLFDAIIDVTPNIQFKLSVLNKTHTKNVVEHNRYADESINREILIRWIQEDNLDVLKILNLSDVYESLKLEIIQVLAKDINLSDVNDQKLWASFLEANAVNPTTQNINDYFEYSDKFDTPLIDFINSSSVMFTGILSDKFYDDLMKQDTIKISQFIALWENYTGEKRSDIQALSNDKVEALAVMDILHYDVETISYFVDQKINVPKKYIDQNFINLVYENNIDLDKGILLDVIGTKQLKVDVIFSRNINLLTDTNIRHYIANFGIEADKLNKVFHKNKGYQNLRFTNSEYMRNILQWLKDRKYILDFAKDNKGKLKISKTSVFERNNTAD